MGTLYVIGAPRGEPDDLTLRAQRILREVDLIAGPLPDSQRFLDAWGVHSPVMPLADLSRADLMQQFLDALQAGDAALLSSGLLSSLPGNDSWHLVQAALERGFPVVPVPGPALTITALLMSGLPADSFVYLGWLRGDALERRALLTSVSGEPRTCIVLALPEHLPAILSDLSDLFGERPLVAIAFDERPEDAWRGGIGEAVGYLWPRPAQSPYILIVGGAREEAAPWHEDRLRSEIQACLDRGLGAKETSHQLATKSGWPRREIYRLAVEAAHSRDKE